MSAPWIPRLGRSERNGAVDSRRNAGSRDLAAPFVSLIPRSEYPPPGADYPAVEMSLRARTATRIGLGSDFGNG